MVVPVVAENVQYFVNAITSLLTHGSSFTGILDRGTFINYWLDKTSAVLYTSEIHCNGVGWPNLTPPLTTTRATGLQLGRSNFTVLVISVEIWTPPRNIFKMKQAPFIIIPTSLLLANKYGRARALLDCRVTCFVTLKF